VSVLILKYRSGEEIRKGDRVLFHGNPAEVELVAVDPNEAEDAWFVQERGGGVMILDPMVSVGIPVKVNIDSGGKPNGIPERR
jgi:hypothetical protein